MRARGTLALATLVLWMLSSTACLGGADRLIYRAPAQLRTAAHSPVAEPPGPSGKGVVADTRPALPPPFSLTAPDGTGLTLERLHVRGSVDGPLALTELHMSFINGETRTIEGRFELTLPPGASLSRFAMRVGKSWQEAEVVERQRARQVYETILHQGLDPALLEQEAGNRFRARVFPIAAHESKELIVSYTQELDDGHYVVPLRGLPKIPRLEVELHERGKAQAGSFVADNHRPSEDLDFYLLGPANALESSAYGDGERVLARVVPQPLTEAWVSDADPKLDALTILFDTSASRGAEFAAKVDRLEDLCLALRNSQSGDLDLNLVAFDQDSEQLYRGPLSALGGEVFDVLLSRGALGASDLGAAVEALEPGERLLLASDGLPTAGVEFAALGERLQAKGFTRVDALLDGSNRDQSGLETLVRDTLPEAGQLLELPQLGAKSAVQRLVRPTLGKVSIEVEGASWSSPREVRGLQPGDAVLVFAEFDARPRKRKQLPLRVTQHGAQGPAREQSLKLPIEAIAAPLLERSSVTHRVDSLLAELESLRVDNPELAATTRHRIVQLSTRHRVLTPYTALLVLESQAAYTRFGLDRDALAPLLTLDDQGLPSEQTRGAYVAPAPSPAPQPVRPPVSEADITAVLDPSATPPSRDQPDDEPDDDGVQAYSNMQELERQAAELMELERREEPKRRERLRALEREAIRAGGGDPPDEASTQQLEVEVERSREHESRERIYAFEDDELEGELLQPQGMNLSEDDTLAYTGTSFGNEEPEEEASMAPLREREPRVRVRARPRSKPEAFAQTELRDVIVRGELASDPARLSGQLVPELARCYDRALEHGERWGGRATLWLSVDRAGKVLELRARGIEGHPQFDHCLRSAAPRWVLVRASAEPVLLELRLRFTPGIPRDHDAPLRAADVEPEPKPEPTLSDAVYGRYAEVLGLLATDEHEAARELAEVWVELFPGDPLAHVALGHALSALGEHQRAARAYASLIDLHPSRADIRRFASNLLESLPSDSEPAKTAVHLARDSYQKAIAARPDQPSTYRMLAVNLARSGEFDRALETLTTALELNLPGGRYRGVPQLLARDAELLAGVWLARDPKARKQILRHMVTLDLNINAKATTHVALNWETDASDVDLHIHDAYGRHAFYGKPQLSSGGSLLADVTTGYGPEAFILPQPDAYPYRLSVHYYRQGTGGHGMGQVQILSHDGEGGLSVDTRPFVVMREHSEFGLGELSAP